MYVIFSLVDSKFVEDCPRMGFASSFTDDLQKATVFSSIEYLKLFLPAQKFSKEFMNYKKTDRKEEYTGELYDQNLLYKDNVSVFEVELQVKRKVSIT
jgi:hypothetical protein